MKVFDGYAKYYDLLYKEKDYRSEAEYIIKIIKDCVPEAKNILDLGCGTGKHDLIFAKNNYQVTGVELSQKMTDLANNNILSETGGGQEIKFINGDLRSIRLNQKFDIITSLFHVINYQTTNEDLRAAFRTVKEHLSPKGKFIFDFWYGPAVLSDRPVSRIRRMEDEECIIERHTEPVINVNENYVDVNFRISITEKQRTTKQELNETHRMRYLFLPEINLFLEEQDMKIEQCEEWMKDNCLSDRSWYGIAVAGNKQ